ncbi:uncharacterized protein LOC127266099 [Andrographis paniculata]|uniref:uncharacterized protein LOC127266099 n=1 Tax=Andrographis paniculata TaxID=175694 RepID=UPI0021E8F651|nr:uncharacterized protein LOC127266099 [Andrographis paniculata]
MCTYGMFQISGYPCCYRVAAIEYQRLAVENFIDVCFKKETYMAVYTHAINPVPGIHKYEESMLGEVAPPVVKVRTGRPKEARRRDGNDERKDGKASRHGLRTPCSKCHQQGHNRRSCKNDPPLHNVVLELMKCSLFFRLCCIGSYPKVFTCRIRQRKIPSIGRTDTAPNPNRLPLMYIRHRTARQQRSRLRCNRRVHRGRQTEMGGVDMHRCHRCSEVFDFHSGQGVGGLQVVHLPGFVSEILSMSIFYA